MTVDKNESIQTSRSWYLIFIDIAKILLVIGIFTFIYLAVKPFIHSIEDLSCIFPHSPWEMFVGLGGMIGLTALGLPFAPATVFGLTIWAIVKIWTCQQ